MADTETQVREISRLPDNKICADCSQKVRATQSQLASRTNRSKHAFDSTELMLIQGPTYINMAVGTFICQHCSGIVFVATVLRRASCLQIDSSQFQN